MDVDEIFQRGVQAVKAGNLQLASDLLAQVVKADPAREHGWLWLARARTDAHEKEYCYKRVLSINPRNTDAKRELGRVGEPNPISPPPQFTATQHPVIRTEDAPDNANKGAGLGRKKALAAFAGLLTGVLICGTPALYLMTTGRLEQAANPMAQAIQTSHVVILASITPSPTISPTATTTRPPTFDERFKEADPYITEAFHAASQGSNAEAIQAWNQVLEIVPEWAEGYYQRGTAYMALLSNQRSLEEYSTYLERAGADFDKAIALTPELNGNYFVQRYDYYHTLASLQESRADSMALEQVAYDNMVIADQVGNAQANSNRNLVFSLIYLNRCQEAIVEADWQLSQQTEPSYTLNTAKSLAYFCVGKTSSALTYIEKALSLKDDCGRNFIKAKMLYVLKRYSEAIGVLDKTFEVCPYYFGERYYLRGIIYADQGDLEQAQNDLYFGSGQTWSQGGLLPYGLGKIALANGDRVSALQYFQSAESSYLDEDPILGMMRADIKKLGGSPSEVTPVALSFTAIPTPTVMATSRPISTLATPPLTPEADLNAVGAVDIEKSLGPIQLNPNSFYTWRFQPAQAIPHRRVQTLTVWILSSDTTQQLPFQIFVWNFARNNWGAIMQPKWGENNVDFPNDHVSRDGDVLIYVQGTMEVLNTRIDQLAISFAMQNDDGSIALVGFTP